MIGLAPRRTPRSGVRNARIVRQPDRVQTWTLLVGLGLGLIVLVPLLANIWTHTEQRRLGYQLDQARDKVIEVKEMRRLLRAEEAVNADLNRIQARAVKELGLEPRRPADTVVVRGASPARAAPAVVEPEVAENDSELVVARAGTGPSGASGR
jgi:cell division protein FtsL